MNYFIKLSDEDIDDLAQGDDKLRGVVIGEIMEQVREQRCVCKPQDLWSEPPNGTRICLVRSVKAYVGATKTYTDWALALSHGSFAYAEPGEAGVGTLVEHADGSKEFVCAPDLLRYLPRHLESDRTMAFYELQHRLWEENSRND